ncbi:hypothetical protein QOZ80_4AG0302640 [Eleusine coracana subsp. coracana]|nr:hypothetical protein QOZ80_4AG0302640 [Eleusine coracana subsp. coracana]
MLLFTASTRLNSRSPTDLIVDRSDSDPASARLNLISMHAPQGEQRIVDPSMAMFKNFMDASLHPPVQDHHARAKAPVSWAMLDIKAYIADHCNATTAFGRTSTNVEIQVTFCTAPPPAISYFCVWCPEPSRLPEIAVEPRIVAAEADHVVLSLVLSSSSRSCSDHGIRDIFIYKAGSGETKPSLKRLVCHDQDFELFHNVIGILPHRNDDINLINDDDGRYHIVGLNPSAIPWQFNLHLSNSKTAHYRIVSLDRQHRHDQFRHSASKVIMLDEEGSCSMGFVDLWRGILVCDVLANTERLNYIPFPRSLMDNMKLHLDPVIARDVAVVHGRIKVMDLSGAFDASGWKATVWSRTTTYSHSPEEEWQRDFAFQVRDIVVDSNTLHLELLPKMMNKSGDDRTSRQTLEELHITHPTLSLDDEDIVYFMAKVDPWDKRAWVLAVDMRNKKLRDVGVFRAERTHGIALSYVQTRISKYFISTASSKYILREHCTVLLSAGMKGSMKRPGEFLLECPRKKQARMPIMDEVVYAPMLHADESSIGDEDGDYMALD